MTAPSLLDELEGVVRLAEKATPGEWTATVGHDVKQQHGVTVMKAWAGRGPQQEHNAAYVVALVNWFRAHHAELADMANELRVARESFKRCDEICKCTAEGWRTAEEDMAKRLEAAERDARVTKRSAETLCRIYFEIAAEAVGEDKVRAERDRRIHAAQEGEG